MNKKYLLSSVTAGFALLYANQGIAQCLNMEDCTALGYTETSCPDGGIKCPFGNGWFCNSITGETCIELGFTQTCSGTGYAGGDGAVCNGKYMKCKCASGYEWTGNACSCPAKYQYTCAGTGYAGGSGTACGGKYTECSCTSPYTWTNGACSCPAKYKYTCTGTGYSGGSGTACGGKYTKCTCKSGYSWSSGKCTKQSSSSSSSGGGVSGFSCCDNMGYGCVCIDDPNRISLCSSVMSGYRAQGCDPVFTGCSGRGNANFKCQ